MQIQTIVIILVVLLIISIIGVYNSLIAKIEAVRNNERQIDIQLDRRYKVFESLVNVVKQYMDYEKSTLKEVVTLRNQAVTDKAQGNSAAAMTAENKISTVLSGLNVVFESYPDLKANQNVAQLQEEIVNTENKLAFSKQAYNDSVETYNVIKKSFFQSFVVSLFGRKLDFNFPYWQIDEAKTKSLEDYTVKL